MKGKISLTLLCTAAIAFACGPRARNNESVSSTTARADARGASATNAANSSARTKSTSDSPLSPTLDVQVEDDVHFEFNIINEGKKKLEIDFADGRTHDLVVLDTLGREVWRWSKGRLFTQAMMSKVLRTSDSLRYEESWKDAEPGTYVAVATLASDNFPITQRVEFTVR